ncbi:MAG: GNAT family N-acetyltransferase [Deltaproteobacteria bacterium]|nr:GNAT family N-acetyltransferase [Deltaproteobacteria bacterium]
MNAFPALETVYYDGWVIRMSDGKTKRVNSVYSIYPSTINIEEKIEVCEKIYTENGLRTVFKLTDQETCNGMDGFLRSKGYSEGGRTLIKTMDLREHSYKTEHDFEYLTDFSRDWYRDLCDADNRSAIDRKVVAEAWKKVVPNQCYISYRLDGKRIAFGRGVMENGFIGIYGIFINQKYRGKGYGELLTNELLAYGKRGGCTTAYLQVEKPNDVARNLYNKIGFTEIYQYWYLLKELGG